MYLRGGFGYGEIKKRLADVADTFLEPMRKKRQDLASDPDAVDRALASGAQRARTVASDVLARVQKACGIKP